MITIGISVAFLAAALCFAAGQEATPAGKNTPPDKAEKAEKKESRWPRVRLGGIYVGAGYSRFSGYPGYGYYPYGYGYPGRFWGYPGYAWDPFFYGGPWIHPGYYNGFAYGPNLGEVKLETSDKTATVYVDGAFAGYSGKLKNMWLEPGAYNLEVRSGGGDFQKRVYVLTGKTLTLDARSKPGQQEQRP